MVCCIVDDECFKKPERGRDVAQRNQTAGIKNWPPDDRPREKLIRKGAGALSNSELLAILLRTGSAGNSAIDLARGIMEKFGTFRNMSHTDSREWEEFRGLGPAKIAQIKAALEIGRRFREDEIRLAQRKVTSAAGKLMAVRVLDHIIIGDGSYFSFADEGFIF